ncbi:lasso peptide biosynthesis B2 protein [Bacillus sp. FJAT-50079]|uniref:lasso peptide biosynthesis B2 protein n=1 Tax=Bacillus sp. FJAT-50079 TaxID=2833577 RepID=UPI001BC8EA91|nr:lasso peptide biosynthesis B2 protein [Bacillus sp. FJAT-50079]MBS4209172.1 lasso peptide biosynthesis B2 protein [Bacillus sp. FJAT-50079]
MKIINKLKTFFAQRPKTMLLLIEAYLFLGWARILKKVPFSKVAPLLGEHMYETPHHYNSKGNNERVKNISHAIHIMSKYTLWESQCLVKAMAGMKMLERRGIDSTLYLGTGRDDAGQMIAHAWLRSGPYYISGAEGMEKFTIVSMFAKKISNTPAEGESDE